MILVKFNSPDEFLTELAAEAAAQRVTDKVVRVTLSYRRGQLTTAVLVLASVLLTCNRMVCLERLAGEYLDSHDADEIIKKAGAVADAIRAEADRLGLEVRAGVYELAK